MPAFPVNKERKLSNSQHLKKAFIIILILLFSNILLAQAGTTQPLPPSNYGTENAGTESNPYLISNLSNLRWLSESTTQIGSPNEKAYFSQTADIDATETIDWNDGCGFIPIGRNGFWGEYDGNRYSISNLYFKAGPETVDLVGFYFVAMFYYIEDSTLKNINLENLSLYAEDDEKGFFNPLVNFARNSVISNCFASGNISLIHAFWDGFSFTNAFTSGLVGRIWGTTVEYCYSTVSINRTKWLGYTGSGVSAGLVGEMENSVLVYSFFYGEIHYTLNYGGGTVYDNNFTGTLVAVAVDSRIFFSYGTTRIPLRKWSITGALVGELGGTIITNCLWDTEATSFTVLFGQEFGNPNKIEDNFGLPTEQMKIAQTFIDNGWDFENIWTIDPEINNGYPFLKGMPPPVVSTNDPVIVMPQTQLIGNYPNPFNPETTIVFNVGNRFNLSESVHVSIDIYNLRGQKVRRLFDGFVERGEHTVVWNGKDENGQDVSSGVYLYQMVSDEGVSTKRMVLMK